MLITSTVRITAQSNIEMKKCKANTGVMVRVDVYNYLKSYLIFWFAEYSQCQRYLRVRVDFTNRIRDRVSIRVGIRY